jgi:hypothetical protein
MKNRTLSIKTRILFLFTLLCAAIAPVQTVHAATITVMNTNNDGAGSLRQAILDSNANPGSDMINFGAAVTGTITLTSGELLITDDLNINGPGANNLAVNGNAASRVFHIASGETVAIDGLTIMNGHGGDGGGIYNDHATLTVSNCTIAGNSAVRGGGIHNNGNSGVGSATLTVLNSTISGNSTNPFGGGGIFNDGFGSGHVTLSVIASTINNNTAAEVGGGIRSEGGSGGFATASVRKSTISGNSATGATHCCDAFGGGGIQNDGKNGSASLEIVNSTFSGNAANLGGGGIYNEGRHAGSATVTLGDTIFNAGSSGENIHNDSGTVTSLGYNLSSDNASTLLNGAGDQNSTAPMLGSLQDNGGPTFTHELLTGSPAIDMGDPNFTPPPNYDQRGAGFDRVVNGRIDIGAFEVQPLYAAQVQQPINADGTSVFNVRRGVVPVKFTLTLDSAATCDLPPATIAVTRTAGGTPGPIDESLYSGPADTGSNFRIDSCQYVYNLSVGALGSGTYRVDVFINSQVVGSATFALR